MGKKRHPIHTEVTRVVRVNPKRRAWRRVIVFFAVISLPVAAYFGTLFYIEQEQGFLQTHVEQQASELAQLHADLADLELQNATLMMASEQDQATIEDLRLRLIEWRVANEDLSESLQFYVSLLDPEQNTAGVSLDKVEFYSAEEANSYNYRMLIAQRALDQERLTGTVSLTLIDDTTGLVLTMPEMSDQAGDLALGFKFFQQLEGMLFLPQGFTPSSARIVVRLAGESSPRIDQTLPFVVEQ